MAQLQLPQDIILLLCQELACRRDFGTLYCCALVSKRVAIIALEQIYSIHEFSPVWENEMFDKKEGARLWKSIIRSSLGLTAYPYCTFIRSLSLSNYGSQLEDLWSDKTNKQILLWMFNAEEDTEEFLVFRDGQQMKRSTRNHVIPRIDYPSTLLRAGESITKYIKEMADQTETSAALTHLETDVIPMDVLPRWITHLPTLTSLQLKDGSVLNVEAASAISQFCPKFSELSCFSCRGSSSDENMAGFLQALPPNTLKRFEIISSNDIGEHTLIALNSHCNSLRALGLGSLSSEAMKCLNMLPQCTAIESLKIENRKYDRVDLQTCGESLLKEITAWILDCHSLKDLSLTNISDALLMVHDILHSPTIRLNSLVLEGFASQSREHLARTWTALGEQSDLENLTLGDQEDTAEGLVIHENPSLASSICKLQGLRSLNLNQATLRTIELRQIIQALSGLIDLSFGGDWVDDHILEPLSTLRSLKTLVINAHSVFTFEALWDFAQKLDPTEHRGINIDINNQLGDWKLARESEASLGAFFSLTLNGRIEIGCFRDPDELHEGDFSESD